MANEEHRGALRRRTFLKGSIAFNHGRTSFDCLVRDLSETGARITVPGDTLFPERFELRLPHRKDALSCVLNWRRGKEIGVHFEAESEAAPESEPSMPPDVARKMKELEAEVVRLRRVLEEIRATPDRVSFLLSSIR